ncbi:MAG: DNA mismatch repair protein MutS [Candidatus Firestonebacteria bacterium]|nr:DNA mismatch repair protein MutS [Candidatus Firestonebacteria bacterium]
MHDDSTPLMEQYANIKKNYMDAILFYRVGDFYETFYDDARIASKVLEIALTSKHAGKNILVPLAGIPYHASLIYINKLIKNGYNVAICEQVEDPELAKGIVKREVIRVISPGTAIESSILADKLNNYLVSIIHTEEGVGISKIDISTGEFTVMSLPDTEISRLGDELQKIYPSECIIGITMLNDPVIQITKKTIPGIKISECDDLYFSRDYAYETLLKHFKTHSLKGFGIDDNETLLIAPSGAIIAYLLEKRKHPLPHVSSIERESFKNFMLLDRYTQRNLELVKSSGEQAGKENTSLLSILDSTITAMGGRLLNRWILQPLLDSCEINKRLDAIEHLYAESLKINEIKNILKDISDLERIIGRIPANYTSPRDLVNLKLSLKKIPFLINTIDSLSSILLWKQLSNELKQILPILNNIIELIDKNIIDEPPLKIKDGGFIKPGLNQELDELRDIIKEGKNWVGRLENSERERTGIKSLKVKFNNVFGYYIEITKSNLNLAPQDYIRKQTLVNAERFITPALKEYENQILNADDKIKTIEQELFDKLKTEILIYNNEIQIGSNLIAKIDVLNTLANVARINNFTKPIVNDSDIIEIKNGRHPVVECLQIKDSFIPNDTKLNNKENQILIITGPNMAGKSTYIRQVALIVLMAQMGSFIPASFAHIGIVDRIFTRIGASDNIARGESTFLVEMNETSNILHNATSRSLIILDEIGRGTSTFDGLSIAWAVVEYIHNHEKLGTKTLFATHYHELTELSLTLPGVKNYNIAVKEWNEEIIFLRKIIEGSADKSYGIQVARLAGLPNKVITRAKEILAELEQNSLDEGGKPKLSHTDSMTNLQLDLFREHSEGAKFLEEIVKIDINNTTPLNALKKLSEIITQAKKLKS